MPGPQTAPVLVMGVGFSCLDLVSLGAVPVGSLDAAIRHMVTVPECTSTISFKDSAAALEPESFTGLILRGKFYPLVPNP